MDINHIIIYLMIAFVLVGAADRMTGSRLKLGNKFEDGIMAMGTLMISTGGLLVLAPLIGDIVRPVIVPAFTAIGADPAMFGGMILGLDIGGAPLAKQLMAGTDGYILALMTASMLGDTISFNIPVGMALTGNGHQKEVIKGVLIGMITIPIGIIVGGIASGLRFSCMLMNILPVAALSLIIIICLWKWEKAIVRVFMILGKVILGISIAGVCVGVMKEFTPFTFFENTMPVEEAIVIIGNVALILAGAYVLVEIITRVLHQPLQSIGRRIGVNETAVGGLLVILANCIPIFSMMPEMNHRGRILTAAFCVSGSFVFGDHLGFIASYAPEMTAALVAAKLAGGISAVILALLITRTTG
ncbi:MAG: ethanolamine utilization protein EutH [Firmicutes bacterium]|nr:ethanolamine utilization protein EutH [Bacillota bacterium]